MKLRVYHIPQIGSGCPTFHIPVETVEEGKKMLDVLSCYDLFQLENHSKPDYSNANGLEMFDENEQEWVSWEDEETFVDDLDDFFEENETIQSWSKELFSQLRGDF